MELGPSAPAGVFYFRKVFIFIDVDVFGHGPHSKIRMQDLKINQISYNLKNNVGVCSATQLTYFM